MRLVFAVLVAAFVLVLAWIVFDGTQFQAAVAPTPSASTSPSSASAPTASPIVSAPTVAAPESVTLTFVGDIMLDRDVWDQIQQQGPDYPYRKINDLFTGSDAIIANLEGPITTRGIHSHVDGPLIFTFDPSVSAPLKQAGITAVSLANNHTYNQGQFGLDETRSNLATTGIASFGDPRTVDASFVGHMTIHGQTLSLIGWNTIEVSDSHLGELLNVVRAEQATSDFVVVMPHWGVEYRQQTAKQIDQAHQLIDAGADLVIGAHPHVVQGIEQYHDHLIVYSMGNFIFDQYWSIPTQRSIAVRYVLGPGAQTATVIPIQLDHAQPTKASGVIRDQILQQLDLSSDTISIP